MERGNITKEDYRRYISQRVNEIEDIRLLAGIWIFVDEIAYRKSLSGGIRKEERKD